MVKILLKPTNNNANSPASVSLSLHIQLRQNFVKPLSEVTPHLLRYMYHSEQYFYPTIPQCNMLHFVNAKFEWLWSR